MCLARRIDGVFSCARRCAACVEFSVFRGQVRFGCGHSESYEVRFPVQAKRFGVGQSTEQRFPNRPLLLQAVWTALAGREIASPGQGEVMAARRVTIEAGLFKQLDQVVDVFPEKALEESRVYALIRSLDGFDNEQALRVSGP